MKITIFAPRRLARPLLFALVGLAGIGSILATSVPGEPFRSTTESFLLVYADSDHRIRVRGSGSGLLWNETRAGTEETRLGKMLANMAGFETLARLGDGRLLTAFITPESRMEVHWPDLSRPGADIAPPVTPDHPLNSGLVSAPAIAAFGDRVVVAWRRGEGPRYELVTIAGTVQGDDIEFDDPVVFKRGRLQAAAEAMAGGTTFKDGVVADPALSHGLNGSFLMAVVRETWEDVQARSRGEESPVRYRVAIYESENGRDWWMHSTIHDSEMPVDPGSVVAIAGFTDSTAIVAAVSGEEGEPAQIAVARYCLGPLWYEQDAQAVFGGGPLADRPIALVSLGEPKPIPPGGYLDCVENRATATPAP